MFGTNEKFKLQRAVYTRRAAMLFIYEDFYKPGLLRLGCNRSGDMLGTTDLLFDIKLTINSVPVSYSYYADEGSLKIWSGGASVEFAITDRGHVRIRGHHAGLRLELRSAVAGNGAKACRGMYALPDRSGWEAEFGKYGKWFIKQHWGAFLPTSHCGEDGVYTKVVFDFLPDAASGEFESAIHEYTETVTPYGEYEEFDELVRNNKTDFALFSEIYRPAAKGYEEIARNAMWTIWSHRTGTTEELVEPVILFQTGWVVTAASWQQSYNAMPMLENPNEAWRQICTMFNYQDERTGRLPGMITYSNAARASGFQPPFQGFALDFIIRQIGDGFLTPEACEIMYPKFAKWVEFWTRYRNAGRGDDVTAIKSPHESGWDDASIFKDGFPANDPNTLAFLVLLMESTGRLAEGCDKDDEADEWFTRAERLTETIIDEFWDGEKFITKVKGKAVESQSLACYQPIILGERLPQEIIDKVAEKLMTEGDLLTEIGLASESMKSDLATFGISFVSGRVAAPQNMILTVGLQNAGKQKEAEFIARRFCDHVKREGVILGFAPYDYYPATGKPSQEAAPPQPADGWPWSSWCANSFLTMATAVIGT